MIMHVYLVIRTLHDQHFALYPIISHSCSDMIPHTLPHTTMQLYLYWINVLPKNLIGNLWFHYQSTIGCGVKIIYVHVKQHWHLLQCPALYIMATQCENNIYTCMHDYMQICDRLHNRLPTGLWQAWFCTQSSHRLVTGFTQACNRLNFFIQACDRLSTGFSQSSKPAYS